MKYQYKQIKNIILKVCVAAALAFVIAGCATTVNFMVEKPPALNTLGIQRLAVMPFSTSSDSAQERQAAAWLTNESLLRIQRTNHFTLVSSSEIDRLRANRGSIESIADALFSGQLISLAVKDSASQYSRKDKEGKTVYYTIYSREVQLAFNYSLTRTRDGSLTGPVNKNVSTNDSNEKWAELQTAEEMIQSLIQSSLSALGRDVAPYMASEKRTLMNESDKSIKQQAKDALALVKQGSLKSAQNAFLQLYEESGSFAAGINTGFLIEAQGNLEEAAQFMQRVYNDTGNQRAAAEAARLQSAMASAGLLEAYKTNQSRRDIVAANMLNTLPSAMPANPRIALVNNSRSERDLAESIISSLLEGFLSKNITVVDRNNQALVEMEKNYQYSGNVSDDEMVRIGHEAGVNAFILVSITGSGAARRLSVRMLDVERGTIIYQSPQTSEMNL